MTTANKVVDKFLAWFQSPLTDFYNPLDVTEDKIQKMGGGLRYNKGKAQINLVPSSLIFAVAKVFEYGTKKYKKNNWREGMSWSDVNDCLQRHMLKWLDGEECDEESGLPHLYHAATNIAMLIEYSETYRDGDNRFKGIINKYQESYLNKKMNELLEKE